MDNFQAIGQLVIKAQDLLDSIKGGAIRVMQTQFDALKQTIASEWGGIKNKMNNDVSTAIGRVDDFENSFHQVGNFKHESKIAPWAGDSTHYNYLLIHKEPDEVIDVDNLNIKHPFLQSGKIYLARHHQSASLKFGVVSFFAGRGYGGVSTLSIDSQLLGVGTPVVVKNVPHDGGLYRAIRFSYQSTMNSDFNITVKYTGIKAGVGGDSNWLKSIAVPRDEPQLGEIV